MPELDDFLGTETEDGKPPIDLDAANPVVDAADPSIADPAADPVSDPALDPTAADQNKTDPDPAEPGDSLNFRKLREIAEATKKERNDWKSEAARKDGEMSALRAQLEALQKAPPAPVAQQAPQTPAIIPNPVEDPQGYHAHIQQTLWNDRLNMSEAMLRTQIGNDADVDAKRDRFQKMVADNPVLRAELQKAPHPYKFAYDTAAKAMAMDEIGDPTSYRAKIEAEIRAQVLAEMAGTAPAPAPRVQLPQSLGTARSASPRNVAVINVPESFNEILAVERK